MLEPLFRGCLLGLLFVTANPFAHALPAEFYLYMKALVVRRPFLEHNLVFRHLLELPLSNFLKPGLIIPEYLLVAV